MASIDTTHEDLLKVSLGYREFTQHIIELEGDAGMLDDYGFAEWLVRPDSVDVYKDWTTEEFESEYDRWNS